jgi:hypothetical protein
MGTRPGFLREASTHSNKLGRGVSPCAVFSWRGLITSHSQETETPLSDIESP